MADNTTLNAGSGGDTIRTLDDGAVKWPAGVTAFATSVGTPDALAIVTPAVGLPVHQQTGATWAVSLASAPLPTGAATAANQVTGNASLSSIDSRLAGTLAVSGPLTDTQLRASAVPVSDGGGSLTVDGTVAVSGSVAVTGTFWQATQPVSGPLTDTELRANAVPVSLSSVPSHHVTNAGTFAVQASQSGTWSVEITGPAPLPTGGATAANQAAGNTSLASIDGKTPALGQALAAGSVPVVLTASQLATLTPPTAITGYATESTLATLNGKVTVCDTGAVTIGSALPAGSNVIGAVTQSGTWTVTGTGGTFPVTDSGGSLTVDAPVSAPAFVRLSDGTDPIATLPVSLASVPSHAVTNAGTFAVQVSAALPSGSNNIGDVDVLTLPAVTIAAAQTLATVTTVGTVTTVTGVTNTVTVNDAPVTSGGLSVSSFLSTAAVQSTAVKTSAGMVYAIEFFNVGATPVYVRLYDQATAPGSGDNANILWRGVVPGNTAGAGFVKTWDKGLAFVTGIGMRCTNLIADTDNTALAASTVIGNVAYK